ncbi:hypothetical protein C7T94_11265 [Pedobacter yulinensis]|uniref:Nucleotidyltransferase n=1 Tax=Pedobacter yulinensis TaxID=2126353 RepID=A0A2T3HLA4_9SPHI|nr:nucleotidyltransferase substrate binding protein [Pedobacter yulinensis]PST83171.1 hypothetical protein C7T94_11265 [Pedobacter yulinensis]
MKDYAIHQGNSTVGGSIDATREVFQLKLITDGHVWMEMIGSRNQTSHTYNKTTVDEIFQKILNDYYPALLSFQANIEAKRRGEQGDILIW